MVLDLYIYILFFIFTIISAFMVITSSNAVHSVLFLILVFCNTSGLILLLGSEFLSLILIIVYVGAIAVLFLFVVMMLNIKVNFLKINKYSVIPISLLIFILFYNLLSISIIEINLINFQQKDLKLISWILESNTISNIKTIGIFLYTTYSFLFIICGIILLVAMVGVIVLTMHQRKGFQTQKIEIQLVRDPKKVIKFVTFRN
nr:NADH dehydrogenase subunit 6 [Calliblepharis sp.]